MSSGRPGPLAESVFLGVEEVVVVVTDDLPGVFVPLTVASLETPGT